MFVRFSFWMKIASWYMKTFYNITSNCVMISWTLLKSVTQKSHFIHSFIHTWKLLTTFCFSFCDNVKLYWKQLMHIHIYLLVRENGNVFLGWPLDQGYHFFWLWMECCSSMSLWTFQKGYLLRVGVWLKKIKIRLSFLKITQCLHLVETSHRYTWKNVKQCIGSFLQKAINLNVDLRE